MKNQESLGYAYDGAEASFELLSRRIFQNFKNFTVWKHLKFQMKNKERKRRVFLFLKQE